MEILFQTLIGNLTLFDILIQVIILLAIVNWALEKWGPFIATLAYPCTYYQDLIVHAHFLNFINIAIRMAAVFALCKIWGKGDIPDFVRWLVFLVVLTACLMLQIFWVKVL